MHVPCPIIRQRPLSPQAWLGLHTGAGVACLGLADWLFFGHTVGVSLAIYLCVLALACACVNPVRASKPEIAIAIAMLLAAVAPVVYDLNFLSFCFATFGLILYSQILSGGTGNRLLSRARRCWSFAWVGYFWVIGDAIRALRLWHARRPRKSWPAAIVPWIVPLLFGAIFVSLFAAANPLIAHVANAIDLAVLWRHLSPVRVVFWCFVLGLIWPYLHLPFIRPAKGKAAAQRRLPVNETHLLRILSQGVLLRSLLLFNTLFAVQTGLDMAYLWGGLRLPGNLTYADYAHQGAYPLCATAIIAALFVLAAAPTLAAPNPSRLLRPLLLLWVGQNLVLVISSLLRLDLYVAVYSLTGLRVAAFLWMGLVGVGLVLITLKIYRRKSSSWLIAANALAAGATLYLCCFVNFSLIIANYNIAHAAAQGGEGRGRLDVEYLLSLGEQAIPAMDTAIEESRLPERDVARLACARQALTNRFHLQHRDWRAFGLESYRLNRYLDDKGETVACPTAANPEPGS